MGGRWRRRGGAGGGVGKKEGGDALSPCHILGRTLGSLPLCVGLDRCRLLFWEGELEDGIGKK